MSGHKTGAIAEQKVVVGVLVVHYNEVNCSRRLPVGGRRLHSVHRTTGLVMLEKCGFCEEVKLAIYIR